MKMRDIKVEKSHQHLKNTIKKHFVHAETPKRILSFKDLESFYGGVEDEEVWHRQQDIFKYEIHSHEYIQE
jgi:hypothetical protein